mgnify:CR=1 FL=1
MIPGSHQGSRACGRTGRRCSPGGEGYDGVLFICADHGNAEKMIDYETGEPHTAHTTNPVPFILVNADPKYTLREGGCLADIAPTLLQIMGLEQPKEMTGKSLLIEK